MQSETRRRRFRSVTPSPSPSRSRSESRDGDRRSRNRSRSSSPRRSSRRQRSRTPTKRHPESSSAREKVDNADGRAAPKRRISRSRSKDRNGKHRSPTARRDRSRSPYDNRTKRSRQRSPYNDTDGKMVQLGQSTLPFRDFDRERAVERARQLKTVTPPEAPPAKKTPVDLMAQQQELAITTRSGGAYIPPARLRAMQASITDKSTEAFQRMSWEALKKSINGLINKVSRPSSSRCINFAG
jgi:pre-mRNA-splicing factor CWC22